MGIKLYSVIIFALCYFSAFPQYEEQRKYDIEGFEDLKYFVENSGSTKTLSSHFHTESLYYDIYLETPDFKLLQKGYSLRFRKRTNMDSSNEASYSFQLKSEMNSEQSIRLEVEEPELSFYQIQTDSSWTPLTTVLDSIFELIDKKVQTPGAIEDYTVQLASWIFFKSEAPISPFQKLQHLGILSTNEIKTLRPVICGVSKRYRSHLYKDMDQDNDQEYPKNRVKRNKLPEYFRKNRNYNWLLESSLDESHFFTLNTEVQHIAEIKELELENKYYIPEKGTQAMLELEKELVQKFHLKTKTDSKYKQAVTKIVYALNDKITYPNN